MSTASIRLYHHALSLHAHRAQLFLSLLGLPHELIDVDLRAGAQKAPSFLRKNPFGQVPVIEDGEVTLADSNAILVYLATRYDQGGRWLPREAIAAGQVQRWLSIAAGPLAAGPGAARLVKVFGARLDHSAALQGARGLLAVLDVHLSERSYLVGDAPTIADVALYTPIAHAPEGGVDLDGYRHVRAWLPRIETLPGFVPMVRSPVAA